ncbi:unnamed protein product [Knipowitschia caucasica]
MYHLIEFVENKLLSIAPSVWVEDGMCFWPPFQNDARIDRACRKKELPGDDWLKFDIRILKTCDQYLEVRQTLQRALTCSTSDLQSDEEHAGPRKRKRKTNHFYGDSGSESSEPEPRKEKRKAPFIPPPPPPTTQAMAKEHTPTSPLNLTFLKATQIQILGLLEAIKLQQEQLMLKVNYLQSKVCATPSQSEVNFPEAVTFPLNTLEDVERMEAWIRGTNMELKQQVIKKLSAIGGQDHKKVTWNILACIFNDSCAQKISWKGVHGKIPFKSMALKTLILEAVKRNNLCRTITDVEIFFSLAVLHIMKMEHDSSSCVLAEYLGLVSQVQAATSG